MEKDRFVERLKHRIPTRWHMSMICAATIASGVLLNRLFLFAQLKHPALRYPLAVALSYAIFYALVYLWLRWQFPERRQQRSRGQNFDATDAAEMLDLASTVKMPEPEWRGGGGGFSGAGASGSWGESSGDAPSSSGKVVSATLDNLDDDGAVVLLFSVFFVALFGSAFYLVYAAPEILLDAAFDFVLASGLLRQTRKMRAEGWEVSILKRTWIAAAIVFALAIACGAVLKSACPNANSLGDYQRLCREKPGL